MNPCCRRSGIGANFERSSSAGAATESSSSSAMPIQSAAQVSTPFSVARLRTLSADGTQGDAIRAFIQDADGVTWNAGTGTWVTNAGDNPMFQNFPHETVNANMLVETYDDLCINCHPATELP